MRSLFFAAAFIVATSAVDAQGPSVAGGVARESLETPGTGPNVLVTNRRAFTIPVSVENGQGGAAPREVQLLVSTDQGQSWTTYARQTPEAKGFSFQARNDGEYWFASRTIDQQGRSKSGEATKAELKILIDAAAPKIEIEAAPGPTGEIKATWRVLDPAVDPASIRLEYQAGETARPQWQPITIEAARLQTSGEALSGTAEFTAKTLTRVIDVRLTARDRAGNIGEQQTRVFLPRVAKATEPRIPEWPPRTAAAPPAPKANDRATGVDPFKNHLPAGNENAATSAPREIVSTPAASPGGTMWPVDNKLPLGPTSLAQNPPPPQSAPIEPAATDRVVAQGVSTGAPNGPLVWPSDAARNEPPTPAVADNSSLASTQPPPREPLGMESVSRLPWRRNDPPAAGEGVHPFGMEKPQLANSRNFSLEYDVESVGPSGVKSAELWVTIDGGRTWEKWGEDDDNKSPFHVQVESERLFGFRMVISGRSGLAGKPPEPGDAADIWVAVDSTKPTARLLQAGYGTGEHSGALDIRWQADDEHLGPRPVTILFSEAPDGPFTTLAAGLPNDGQYYWMIDQRTPRRLYLRLEVRDDAGNLGLDQTTEPVSLEGLTPRGRIRAVAPAGAAIQGAFRKPLFR